MENEVDIQKLLEENKKEIKNSRKRRNKS